MATDHVLEFECRPGAVPPDETERSLRAYVASIADAKLAQYDPAWSDEQAMAWDDNFRDDGVLMLICCERDVAIEEFREVVEEFRQFRKTY